MDRVPYQDVTQEPNFRKYSRAFDTVVERLQAKINALGRDHDSDFQYKLLQEASEDVKNATKYLGLIDKQINGYQYHQKSQLEGKARARLRLMKKKLSRHAEVLKGYALALDPDSTVAVDEEHRVHRRRLNNVSAIQMDNRVRIGRTRKEVDDTQQKGRETMRLLAEDTEALERTRNNLDMTGSINSRARALMNRISSRVWRDRALQIGIILTELAIIVLIIFIKFLRN
ncbi:hypothetical protein AAMO2058_000317400 [Amorphochlora amoebiformis]